jgi:DNA-binding transcriptional regulator GbsR (MarR family)
MKKYSKYYSIDTYKPGGITEKLSLYSWMLNDRVTNLAEARRSLDPDNHNPEIEEQIEKLRKNLEGWSNQYYEFKNKPNNDPDIIKTIFDSLVQLSKHEVPTQLYRYMTELNNITITDPDINYLLDIFKAQRETFERTYFDDVADNIDQTNSREEAETELPTNIFSEELTRKISNNYNKIVKLAAYYDKTEQYKKADKIEKSLKELI